MITSKVDVITSYSIHYTKLYEILLDVVLGYGSNLQPDDELVPAFEEAKKINPNVAIICSITGVITSYSIHYTKLYDNLVPLPALSWHHRVE